MYHDLYATPYVEGSTIRFQREGKIYQVKMKDDIGDEFSALAVTIVSAHTE